MLKRFILLIIFAASFSLFPSFSRAAVVTQQNFASSTLNNGLVGWWTFDSKDVTDKVYDRSGSGNHGYYVGMATSTAKIAGKIGQALNFNGVTSLVQIPSSPSLNVTNNITLSAWVYLNAYQVAQVFSMADNGGYRMRIQVNGAVGFYDRGGTNALSTTEVIPLKKWTFVTVTGNSSGLNIYIDGRLSISGGTAFGGGSQSCARIGSYNAESPCTSAFAASEPMNGYIDEVRVYNRAFSDNEVKKLYQLGQLTLAKPAYGSITASTSSSLQKNLIGWWTMDGIDTNWRTNTIMDRSGLSNNGTIVNMSTSTAPKNGKLGQSIRFDGVDDYVDINSVASAISTGDVTYSAWVNFPNGYGPGPEIMRVFRLGDAPSNNDLVLQFSNRCNTTSLNGALTFCVYGPSGWLGAVTSSKTTWDAGRWYFVAGTYTSGSQKLYIDGVEDGSGTYGARGTTAATHFRLGKSYDGDSPSSLLYANLDDARVYNRVLSAAEIKQLYLQGQTTVAKSPTYSQNSTSLNSGLVGYWTFDGKDTNWTLNQVMDRSGSGFNGVLTNMSTTSSPTRGVIGQALNFDGVDDYVYIASAPVLSGPFTVSQWLRFPDVSAIYTDCMWCGSNNATEIIPSTVSAINIRDNSAASLITVNMTRSIVVNKWVMITVRRDASNDIKVFMNGTDVTSGTYSHTGTFTFTRIGRRGDNWGELAGAIDEARMYNRALSDAEIKNLYNMTK